jgi:hypothetical protein
MRNYGNNNTWLNTMKIKYGSIKPTKSLSQMQTAHPNDCLTCTKKPRSKKDLMCQSICGK